MYNLTPVPIIHPSDIVYLCSLDANYLSLSNIIYLSVNIEYEISIGQHNVEIMNIHISSVNN